MGKKIYTIGRTGDVKLNDETVSRHHACLEVEGDALFLRDLGSRNGTFEVCGEELKPFAAGAVRLDQVFAFGECLRSVSQILKTAVLQSALANSAAQADSGDVTSAFDTTRIGSAIAPRKRLTSADIIQMLERAEEELATGRGTAEVCMNLGITVPRYERWCREYGATRREREGSLSELRMENARLRKLVDELQGKIAGGAEPAAHEGAPNISLVGKREA